MGRGGTPNKDEKTTKIVRLIESTYEGLRRGEKSVTIRATLYL
jgi:hypothetical protein